MFLHSPSSRLCNRRRLSNGPDILLCDFYEHSSLRVGAEQEQLAFGDPVSGSGAAWAFTENDLALGVQMLHARNKYPWFEMQTLYPFDKTGVRTAVADAMAMRTVKSTIVPFPHLLEA
jgi:hypothetical protein